MTRYLIILFCAAALSCAYPSEPQIESLCAPPLRGRVVGAQPQCAGLIIQVIDGSFMTSQVQETFTDSNGNTISNTFRLLGVCEMPESDALWLADPDNVGEDFLFYFAEAAGEDNCAYCKPYVLFPDVSSRITLSDGGCNDTL